MLAFFSFLEEDCLTIWAAIILSSMVAPRAPRRRANNRVQVRLNDTDNALLKEMRVRTQLGNSELFRRFLHKMPVKDQTPSLVLRELAKLAVTLHDPRARAAVEALIRKITGKSP